MKYSQPPAELVKKSKPALDALVAAADLKHVPPKAKGRRGREQPKPLSGLNVDELLDKEKIIESKISIANAIPDFLSKLENSYNNVGEGQDGTTAIQSVAKDFLEVIEEIITHSLADTNYAKAAECLKHLRKELIEFDEPQYYNVLVESLKKKLFGGDLGGDRSEMWDFVIDNRLGLVKRVEGNEECATDEEAREFLMRPE